ncbi:hypothetical protein SVIOM342S_04615 [Streptomyces violaceorubidus]
MTRGRWLLGTALLLTALVTLGASLAGDPGDLLHRKTYVQSRPMLLITAVALLTPVAVRPLTRVLAWLPARLPGAGACWCGRTRPPGSAVPRPSPPPSWSPSRSRARCSAPPRR